MIRFSRVLTLGILLSVPVSAPAQEAQLGFGGDQYASGQQVVMQTPVERDAFVAGYNVTLAVPVAGDAHLAGFNVNSQTQISGDLYSGGFNVSVSGPVGGDLTAAGNSVHLLQSGAVGGNARLAGASVILGAPVQGSALVAAQTLTLDGTVSGDLSFFGENITFAPGAKVEGIVTVRAPREIAVPPTVAPAERVTYMQYSPPDYVSEAGRTAENVVRGFWPAVWAAAAWWLVLIAVGAGVIALMPNAMRRLEEASQRRPFRALGIGLIALAATLGLVPVTVLTLVGILLLPLVLLFVAIWCSLGYLAGSYFLGARIARAFVVIDDNPKRLGVLAGSLILAILLGMIPFVGWLVTLLIVVFGLGTIGVVLMVGWSGGDVARASPSPTAAPMAASPGS